jgi:beta-phosphoglucomutase-like phosphatase (HAD superfamily)
VSTSSPVRLVLFDVDGTLVDHDGAAAAAVQQWLLGMGWADSGALAGLVSDWDSIAERHFPAYRARLTTFQGQRRLRLRSSRSMHVLRQRRGCAVSGSTARATQSRQGSRTSTT